MVHPDFYGDITGTGERRTEPVNEETRGPDSVECSPDSRYQHSSCAFDFMGIGPRLGFLCGCVCHDDPESDVAEEAAR